MVSAFGQRLLVSVDEDGWQGDSYKLIADGDEPGQRYGVLIFGWGSCSGCDAFEGCSTVEDYQQLADSLQDSIKWFSDKEGLMKYAEEHDWKGDFVWHSSTFHDFFKQLLEFVESERE